MNLKLQATKPIFPPIGILMSLYILFFGLAAANNLNTLFVILGIYLLMYFIGYYKSALAVLPCLIIFVGLFTLGAYYSSGANILRTYSAANRALSLMLPVVIGLGVSPAYLTRSLNQIKVPKSLTLGMMICVTFFPLLKAEIKQIREAMRTRGAGSLLKPSIMYRAFLIPLVIRLVNISDTLSLSIETRGFSLSSKETTIYKKIKIQFKDIMFVVFVLASTITSICLWWQLN